MKKVFMIMAIVMILCVPALANNHKEVDVVSCRTDLKVGKYDDDTKLVLEIREGTNTYTNVYSKQQIQRSNKDYSYIIDGSNCVYLNESDYKTVKDDENATFWIWFIGLGLVASLILYVKIKS